MGLECSRRECGALQALRISAVERKFMQLSAAGLEFIKREEGFRSSLYQDVAGILTIGYGHRVTPSESFSSPITEAQATALLQADVRQAEQWVARLVKVILTQGQFDALVDFCFNLGCGRLKSSTLLAALNAGHYAAAAEQLLSWDHANGQVNPGLKARRTAELQLFIGHPSAMPGAPVPPPPGVLPNRACEYVEIFQEKTRQRR
jgi:lysozyme